MTLNRAFRNILLTQLGSSQRGLPNWVQQIVTGVIIILAVALDHWRQHAHHNL